MRAGAESAAAAMTAEKGQVARDSAWNFGAAAVTAGCSGLRALLLPKLLPSVDAFGIFNILNLFRTYSPYVNAGVLMGYGVEVPRRRGSGETAQCAALADTAYTFSAIASLLFALGMLALVPLSAQTEVRTGLVVFAIVVVLQNLMHFYADRLRVELNFRLRSQQEAVFSLGFTALAVGCAAWFGLYAIFAGLVFGQVLALWWMHRLDPYRPAWHLDRAALGVLVRLGIPVTVMSVLSTLIFDVDLILIKWWFPGYREAGLYALGVTFSALMMMVPYTVGHALAPRIFHEAGRPDAERDLLRYVRKPVLLLTGLAAAGSGAAFLAFPLVLHLYLPRYLDGLPAMRLLVWYTAFNAALTVCGYVFGGCKSFARIITLQVAVIAVNLALNLLLLQGGGGITGIAAVTVLSYALYAAGGLLFTLRLCRAPRRETAALLAAVGGGTGACAVAAVSAERLASALLGGIPGQLLALPCYALFLLPLAWLAQRRFGLVSELWSASGGMLRRGNGG